jgi:hypothetical protein
LNCNFFLRTRTEQGAKKNHICNVLYF